MVINILSTIDAAYNEIIVEKQSKAIKSTFLVLWNDGDTAHSFESNIRLDAMNQFNRMEKAGSDQVHIYRLSKVTGTYGHDTESQNAAYDLLDKQRKNRNPEREVPAVSTRQAKAQLVAFKNLVHAATAGGNFNGQVRAELIKEFLVTITAIGGSFSEVADMIDELSNVE